MVASFEHPQALWGNKATDSGRMFDSRSVSPRLLAPALRGPPPPYTSTEATAWYHADLGSTLSPRVRVTDPGTPWDRDTISQGGSRNTIYSSRPYPAGEGRLFSELGVPPVAMSSALKGQRYVCKWKGPKPGWGTDLLPPRPSTFAASLGGGRGSHPISDAERKNMVWSPRDYVLPTIKLPTFDPIHGIAPHETPESLNDWATTYSYCYTGHGVGGGRATPRGQHHHYGHSGDKVLAE